MQSAIRGGGCSGNIRGAFRHLSSHPRADTRWRMAPEPPGLWLQVFGEVALELWALIREVDEAELGCCPATLFADQSKAFERLGHLWLRR
eukprot:137788-Alexandrium_andersonii.AAC.1